MRQQWIAHALQLARMPSSAYASDRKILTNRTIEVDLLDDLTLDRVGYTDKKMADLARGYVHEESRACALDEWNHKATRRRKKPFAVGFHTYNHLRKSATKRGVGAEKMGPCMQAVAVTCAGGRAHVAVQHRSADLFRVFAADLVFVRDVLLAPFDLRGMTPTVRFNVASVTCHPRDFPFVLCNVEDPVDELMKLKREDPRFHGYAVKWLASYICEEHGASIANYEAALRRQRAVLSLMPEDDLDDLRDYCRRQLAQRQSRGAAIARGARS